MVTSLHSQYALGDRVGCSPESGLGCGSLIMFMHTHSPTQQRDPKPPRGGSAQGSGHTDVQPSLYHPSQARLAHDDTTTLPRLGWTMVNISQCDWHAAKGLCSDLQIPPSVRRRGSVKDHDWLTLCAHYGNLASAPARQR